MAYKVEHNKNDIAMISGSPKEMAAFLNDVVVADAKEHGMGYISVKLLSDEEYTMLTMTAIAHIRRSPNPIQRLFAESVAKIVELDMKAFRNKLQIHELTQYDETADYKGMLEQLDIFQQVLDGKIQPMTPMCNN